MNKVFLINSDKKIVLPKTLEQSLAPVKFKKLIKTPIGF